MTDDKVEHVLNAKRVIKNGTITYTIWPDNSPARIVIAIPERQDEATRHFLATVIDYTFSRSMLMEFEQSDLTKEVSDGAETSGESDAV